MIEVAAARSCARAVNDQVNTGEDDVALARQQLLSQQLLARSIDAKVRTSLKRAPLLSIV